VNGSVSARALVALAEGGRAYLLVTQAAIEFLYRTRIAKMIAKLVNSSRMDDAWARFDFVVGFDIY
jgi:hypothetical protein